ncbi:MAG: hypothetical protein MASP_01561 [Candidatus Methanolliviera sp. GoM_asphalt]|nr:MAG: hypothetical protein MASP_01561 [Candidatus Methanolliviera sp. GoM_asphalt]
MFKDDNAFCTCTAICCLDSIIYLMKAYVCCLTGIMGGLLKGLLGGGK